MTKIVSLLAIVGLTAEIRAHTSTQAWNQKMADETDLDLWNAEYEGEVEIDDLSNLVVYSRDWTVETIFSQIKKGNIDLDPEFQRRNAWTDHKRSKLIESLIAGLPVPQIVLAEDQRKKGSFIVIDGKQRLLALSGFIGPKEFPYWDRSELKGLSTRTDLENLTMTQLSVSPEREPVLRQFMNADIRCAVITGYSSEQVLYDIFYRLNSASVPLSSQELRQVLNRGPFSKMIMQATNKKIPLHEVMGLSGPDSRLRDAEILLRYIALRTRGSEYRGNLSVFLDDALRYGNDNWAKKEGELRGLVTEFHEAVQLIIDVFPAGKAGRKFADDKWESRFNRVLLEVEAFYFARIERSQAMQKKEAFEEAFRELSAQNAGFKESIESTTKTVERYYTRFEEFQKIVNKVFNLSLDVIPTPGPSQ